MPTLSQWDTIRFPLIKKGKKHDTTGKTYIVVVELGGEEVQVEILEPKDSVLKFNLDEDIKGECEICVKEVDGDDVNTIYEDYFTIN